jgi:hypothetical protein
MVAINLAVKEAQLSMEQLIGETSTASDTGNQLNVFA